MKNFVFISPNFPTNYWHFCRELKNNGINVLGIGDQPYDELLPELRDSLQEYYKVGNLENYDEVYRAVAFFTFKYGRIDYLESNNEYWLMNDARLRSDFNISTGFRVEDMDRIKYKSKMKEFYLQAGIPVARYHIVDDLEGCRSFLKEVGYPVCAKPDNGVGASDTYKINNEAELVQFMEVHPKDVTYIMEEFIFAQVNSYDAIINSRGEPIFETGNMTLSNLIEVVNDVGECLFFIHKDLPEDLRAAGRAAVKSFGVRSRFVHFEFFRLTRDQAIGKKGDVVALEVNMRPSGGFSPEMMNYANSTDVYKIWADMIAFDQTSLPEGEHFYCASAGRRDGRNYALSHQALEEKYRGNMKMAARLPDALAGLMGNQLFLANFSTWEELEAFFADAQRCAEG